MASQIDKTLNTWKEKEAIMSPNVASVKSVKRFKTPKKSQEWKKLANDVKIEDVFLNSEYFKYHTGNISSLSFCSGDNGENQWTVDSKFEMPLKRKTAKTIPYPSYIIKSDTAVVENEKLSKQMHQKFKKTSTIRENCQESNNKITEENLSEKSRLDQDLVTLVTDQMFLAERELQITRTHLIETINKLNERDLEILQLHETIQKLQKTKQVPEIDKKSEESSGKLSEDYQKLIKASDKLKKQVRDMEEFLNDYGLVWIGDKEGNSKPDFDKIIKNFQRLNSVASEPKIRQTTVGAKFEIPREITVVLYSNGLLLRNKDFREYNKLSTITFLEDVEDGYFPSELQAEFPQGVPFEVIDKRNEIYTGNTRIPAFQGQGNRLGSTFDGKPPPIVYLQPLKNSRNYDFDSPERADKNSLKKLNKKKSANLHIPEEKIQQNPLFTTENHQKVISDHLKVKVRFGKDVTQSFILEVPKNEKMYSFQKALQAKLCEKFHDSCLVDNETNYRYTDFEIHVYGKHPIRLSESLNKYPRECGIVTSCLVNVTEI